MIKAMSDKPIKVISLRRQLLKNISLISLALSLLGVLIVTVTALYSNSQVFDHLLNINARVLLFEKDATREIDADLRYLNEEMDIEWQKWQSKGDTISIVDSTYNAPTTPFVSDFQLATDDISYYNIMYHGEPWRVLVLRDVNPHIDAMRYIQIAQPWHQRLEFTLPTMINYIWVMLAMMLALLIGTVIVIRKGLAPMHNLRQALDKKSLSDLSAIEPPVVIKETQPLIDTINALLARLARAYASQERFTADASHELRTPLAAISMKLQLLERRYRDTEGLTQALAPLRADVARATTLTESLLALARLDGGADDANLSPMQVDLLLDTAAMQMQDKCQSAGVTLLVDCPEPVKSMDITINTTLMTSALINLINNALLHAPSENAALTQIRLSAQTQTMGIKQLLIRVQDDGQGVVADKRTQLTERFFRLSGDTKTGSGLGLSIVQKIAEHHGGSVQFSDGLPNTQGTHGLGVVIILPIA